MGGKKSSCILLLAAFAAFLRLGSAEGDPLPPSLVDMVRDSPISSIEDLKKLLDTDSVEEESDSQTTSEIHSSDDHHRVPRSLIANAEQAQQAACKVRTEVLEVTRSMHDRTNAHFMLWPPCVEVQRCSGCCNSRTSQCVPVVTEIRQLQMIKITYVNMRPQFDKVVVPVEDHVRCDCQPLTSGHASSRASTPRRPQATPPPPPAPRLAHKPQQPHGQTKEDLHRHDQLKHNQRLHLEERQAQERLWQNKYSPSHTAGEPRHTPGLRLDFQAEPRHAPAHTPSQHPLGHAQAADGEGAAAGVRRSLGDGGQQEEARQPTFQHGSGDDNRRHTRQQHQQHHPQHPEHHHRLTLGEQQWHQPTQSGTHMLRDATTPHQQRHGSSYHHSQSEAPVYHHSQSDMASHPDVQSQGSSHHGQSEGSSHYGSHAEVAVSQGAPQEEEKTRLQIEELEKERQEEVRSQPHQDSHNYHQPQPQSQPQTSTQRAVTDVPTTLQPPSRSSQPQTTPRPAPPRRRRRKHRRRISKATMRAMIMVMS